MCAWPSVCILVCVCVMLRQTVKHMSQAGRGFAAYVALSLSLSGKSSILLLLYGRPEARRQYGGGGGPPKTPEEARKFSPLPG